MDLENIFGQMAGNILVNGKMENSMEKENTFYQVGLRE